MKRRDVVFGVDMTPEGTLYDLQVGLWVPTSLTLEGVRPRAFVRLREEYADAGISVADLRTAGHWT